MAVDLSAFDNLKTLADYQRNNQQYAQQQQLGQMDLQTKKNVYAAQIMSQVSAPVAQDGNGHPIYNPDIYKSGLEHLQQMGIDTNGWSQNPAEGAQQAAAARMALISPQGWANLQIQAQRNGIQAAGVNSTNAPANNPLSGPPLPVIGASQPTSGNALPLNGANNALPLLGNPDASPDTVPSNSPPALQPPPAAVQGLGENVQGFMPSQGPPNESPKGKKERIDSELAVYNAKPSVIQQKKEAEAAGTAAGTLPEKAATSQEITDRLTKNVQKLLSINPDTPDSHIMSPEDKAWWSKRYGSGKAAGKLAEWNQVDQQQILSDYGQLVSSGQIKGSRAIFQALQTGSGVPADEPISARTDLLNNLLAEIQNKNVTSQNLNADINGGQRQPYNDIPTSLPGGTSPPSKGWGYVGKVK